MLVSLGPMGRPTPLGVIMYGLLIPRTTLISAQSTTGQRAISRITPRQESRRFAGWNQRRAQHHIRGDISGTGRKYTRKRPSETSAIGLPTISATVGSAQRTASDTDQSVYQLWHMRNWRAWRTV